MRKKLSILCIGLSTAAFAQTPAGNTTTIRQPLLSRFRSGQVSEAGNQLQREPVQLAQPANGTGYRPGVTYPQQMPRQTPPQQPAQPQQPGYAAYPPQQTGPGSTQQTGPRPTPAPTPKAAQSESATSNRTGRSASKTNESDNESKSNSSSKSSDKDSPSRSTKSTSRSEKSSDDSENKESSSSSSSNKNSESDKNSSAKASSSSALEKIVKNVESGTSDAEEKPVSSKSAAKVKATPEPKKTAEEIAAEKTHALAIKAADDATTVVAGFLKQANDGYYSKASESLAPAIQKYFDSEISAVNGPQKTVLDELTSNGTINMVTYINTTVRGEGAVVEAELGYGDGHTARRSFDLIKIKDDWKIVLPVIEDHTAPRAPASQPVVAAQSTPIPALTPPPTAEQAANRGPLMMAPGVTNPQSGATTIPQ